MDFTYELSRSFNLSPFEILNQDKDQVIMMINYFSDKPIEENYQSETTKPLKQNDGFWDF